MLHLDTQFVEMLTLNAGGDGAGANFPLTNGLSRDYDYWGLLARVSGRAVVATANATLVPVLSPVSFIERVQVFGTLRGVGRITLCDLPGTLLFALASLVSGKLPEFDDDSLQDLAGAIGTFDFAFTLPIPLCVDSKDHKAVDMAARSLLPGGAFTSPLEVIIQTGGNDSIIDRAETSTVTMTAFGSASGDPTAEIHRVVGRNANRAARGQRYIAQKYMQGPFALGSNLTDGLIGRIGASELYTRMLFRVGDLDSDSDPALGGVSNTALSRYFLRLGAQQTFRNKQFLTAHHGGAWLDGYDPGWGYFNDIGRGYLLNRAHRQFVGCALEDFVADGRLESAFNAQREGLVGKEIEIHANVTTETGLQLEVGLETIRPV